MGGFSSSETLDVAHILGVVDVRHGTDEVVRIRCEGSVGCGLEAVAVHVLYHCVVH